MTKPENRAAAEAWREYREQQRRDTGRAADIAADLVELDRPRRYPIFGRFALGANAEKPRGAIDDYVEQLTGERTKLPP